ncbi:hypothetical protein OBV_23780 [Oscillibacter valericigenes Sjm18-20]|nr:hypothetical protein OBV_23780 [Oscillibacter valericigenes Sjm18-20]
MIINLKEVIYVIKDINFLIDRMKISRPVLLLGAGFSYGATNGEKEPLPMGKVLSHDLYKHFFVEGELSSLDSSILKEIEGKKDDLKEVCTYLRYTDKEKQRNEYLTRAFRNCNPSPEGYHNKLLKYPWEYIFTLNIDDLIEKIYRDAQVEISVWDKSNPNGNNRKCTTNLIKLHGSVNDLKGGYIFDSYEYKNFTIDSNSLLKEFAHQSLQHDLILVGTQFQEDDLQTILDIYERSGYSRDPFYRIFLSPSISGRLRLQIQNSPNDIWIKCDTKTFLNALEKDIQIQYKAKSYLLEKGVIFLENISRSAPSSFELYKGFDAVYPDFFHNADILPKDLELWKQEISSSETHILMAFYGESYIGKTCFVKRLLVELFYAGYIALQLNRFDDRVYDLLSGYLRSLPDRTKVAVYIDNASYYYKQLIDIKKQCPSNIDKLVIITEDTIENHNGKEYILLDDPTSIFHLITAEMNEDYATEIYEKLSRNNRLNKYLQCIPQREKPFSRRARELITSKINEENDIIDALYYSTEGNPFQKHYKRWLDRYSSDEERKLLYELCYLFRLGVTIIPNSLVTKLGTALNKNFRLDAFCKKYAEVVSVYYGWVRLHRGRILNHLIDTNDLALIMETLHKTAIYTVPTDERVYSETTPIFQKVLRVKRMRNSNLLPKENILKLLNGLEGSCSHTSYFWVQYGIAAQINKKYEDANNHLSYAHSMRPYSYNVNHALAKNQMEWGLYLLKNEIGDGELKFSNGADNMLGIIEDTHFSGGYRYSVHAYVRMWLEYAKTAKETLPYEICKRCANLLESLLERPLDNMLTDLIKDFIAYCDNNALKKLSANLKTVYYKRERFHVEQESYDIN